MSEMDMNEIDFRGMLENKIKEFELNGFNKIACDYRYVPSHSTKVYGLDGSESLQVYSGEFRFRIMLGDTKTSDAGKIEDMTKKIFYDSFVMNQPTFFDDEIETNMSLVSYFIRPNIIPTIGVLTCGNDTNYLNDIFNNRIIDTKKLIEPSVYVDDKKMIRPSIFGDLELVLVRKF